MRGGDSVIVDTAPGLRTLLSRAVIAVADVLLVHVVPEPGAERHVIDVLGALRGMGGAAAVVIVATMVGIDRAGPSALRVALAIEGLEIGAEIPREADVNDAIWSGSTTLGAVPRSKASEAYRSLARRVHANLSSF